MLESARMLRFRKGLFPYALILPAAVALLFFSIYPFISGIWYSFTSVGWVNDVGKFVGLDNYRIIFEGEFGAAKIFKEALLRSGYWTVGVVGGQFLVGLFTALVLNEKFPGRGIFRVGILLSIAMPTVILALTWQWMLDPFYGLINFYLQKVGLLDGPKVWVGQTNSPLWPLIVIGIWRGFPFMALMLLSGLQSIPDELYEAAKVDGANAVDRFFHITLPQLQSIIVIAVMLHLLWWWNHFDIIMIAGTVGGEFSYGAATIPYLAWVEAFRWSHLSRGAAISVIAILVVVGIIFWNARREMRSVSTK